MSAAAARAYLNLVGSRPGVQGEPEPRSGSDGRAKVGNDAPLAEMVQPYRMAMVSAAFPYRAQLDAYRRALGAKTVGDLAATKDWPRFLRFHVRRRAIDATGRVVEDWAKLNLAADYAPVLARAADLEPEAAALKPVVLPGEPLVMARPKLARGTYPSVRLKRIEAALRAHAERAGDAAEPRTLSALERRLQPGRLPIFDPSAAKEEQPAAMPRKQPAIKADVFVPDYCLLRWCDVNVQPGMTYQYQVQVRLANPNFGKPEVVACPSLAQVEELTSDWAPQTPVTAVIDREQFSFATGLWADRETALVEMQRWLERVRLDPAQRMSEVNVGLWVSAEVPVRRGEFVRGQVPIEVPIWFPTRQRFGIAPPPPTPRGQSARKGTPIDFATPDLLVDWEGGERLPANPRAARPSGSDMELLILSADGTLRVRRSRADARDPGRLSRHAEWKKALQEARGSTGNSKVEWP